MLALILRARKRILEWNSIQAEPKPMPPALEARLRGELRDDVQRLSRLIGRNLDHWLAPQSATEAAAPRETELKIWSMPQPVVDTDDLRGVPGHAASASPSQEAGMRF